MTGPCRNIRCTDKGAVLLICLLMLIALSLLGLAAASDHILQDRMSNNLLDATDAGNSADAALTWGEEWLLGQPGLKRPLPCSDACTESDVIRSVGAYGLAPEQQDLGWWQANAYSMGQDPVTGTILDPERAAQNPGAYWLIEEIHTRDGSQAGDMSVESGFYRILARGSGRDSPSESSRYAIVESIVARPWGDAEWLNGFPRIGPANSFCSGEAVPSPCGRLGWHQLH